jgi:N-acetylglucosamine malate deacetylase 1
VRKVLFISVHGDDETLGCGGTILKHKKSGDDIFWLIVTEPKNSGRKEIRRKEIERVSIEYGFKKIYNLNIPSTKLDLTPTAKLIEEISDIVNSVKPEILYLPNRTDVHTDHQIAFKAVYSCTKSFRYPFIRRVLMYETLSETEFAPPLPENTFMPNVFIDITEFFEKKREILQLYKGEVMEPPYPRSLETLEALAKLRGSRIGVKYAECFQLIFERI